MNTNNTGEPVVNRCTKLATRICNLSLDLALFCRAMDTEDEADANAYLNLFYAETSYPVDERVRRA